MSKERFTFDKTNLIFNDNTKGEWLDDIEVCELLNQQQERISELEEQLKNCIRPKFKIGQEVWYVEDKFTINSGEVLEIQIWNLKKDNIIYVIEHSGNFHCESVVFETLEEAQAKLEELGENK